MSMKHAWRVKNCFREDKQERRNKIRKKFLKPTDSGNGQNFLYRERTSWRWGILLIFYMYMPSIKSLPLLWDRKNKCRYICRYENLSSNAIIIEDDSDIDLTYIKVPTHNNLSNSLLQKLIYLQFFMWQKKMNWWFIHILSLQVLITRCMQYSTSYLFYL
jgi:hypothetical protein